ncbi:acetyl-CoA hydrolase/transferase C-terminal domain-containing protein [Gallaecimonas mangrovi]|uniref:acetyl-CoA hydrolase/transferase C-terminal domain-containing protein n=1 Tax=Gallaecimonas mangrovi TaxID=2291597 RepID=UPI000E1FE42B|nr:acetyl-CoA hydrolase/transferase C-terminal domain-containing protein [Gallaecimonas mangrovi]
MQQGLMAQIEATLGSHWVLGTPMGVGKANRLLNRIYRHVKANPHIHLTIITALSLNPPKGKSDLERRFLSPLVDRVWQGYERLAYLDDVEADKVPEHIEVIEFYTRSGAILGHPKAQQNYISSNYTHAARDILARGINLLVQAVAISDNGESFSLGSNPDLSLDVAQGMQTAKRPTLVIGEVNRQMPFMGNGAVVDRSFFDHIIDDRDGGYPLFVTPQQAIDLKSYAIGLRASRFINDGGTLQVGIGALADAAVQALLCRQQHNQQYQTMLKSLGEDAVCSTFNQGLYVASELISYPVFSLFEQGIVKRRTYEDETLQDLLNRRVLSDILPADTFSRLTETLPQALSQEHIDWLRQFAIADITLEGNSLIVDGNAVANDMANSTTIAALNSHCSGRELKGGIVMQGAFLIGPSAFYKALHQLSDNARSRIDMTSVLEVNRIYSHYRLEHLQRQDARFINITMKATLLGHAVSDQLADGQVVSGVGGQFNFVNMAHQLPDGRSILLVKATRGSGSSLESNIVWEYPHSTIPRHLRDIVICEYGVADLRGKTDAECIDAMIKIADSRFQNTLIKKAISAGKLPANYQLAERYRHNLPARLEAALTPFTALLTPFPFGSELTDFEVALAKRLAGLAKKATSLWGKVDIAWQWLKAKPSPQGNQALAHLQLTAPRSVKERFYRRLVLSLFR